MLLEVADLIVDVARKEDTVLRRLGKGIFMVPELAFAYAVGKELALNARFIFGTSKVSWKLETTLSNNLDRTDLVFDIDSQSGLAIEFKMAGRYQSYVDDINKLKKIQGNYEKIFCALINAWPNNLNDCRIEKVEELQPNVERLCRDSFFDFFSTLDETNKKQICCIVGVWHVKA